MSESVNSMNNSYLAFNVNGGYHKSESATATRGSINKVDNIQVEHLQIQSINNDSNTKYTTYDYSDNINNIYTNTENNKEQVYYNEKNYEVVIAPSDVLNSISGTFNTLAEYTMLAGNITKTVGKTFFAMKDNGQISFTDAYQQQSLIDEIQEEQRKNNKNFLYDSEEYNAMVVDKGLVDESFTTIFYADSKLDLGYNDNDFNEIGINLKDGRKDENNNMADAGTLENTYWHEVSHKGDKTNTTTTDRENYATNMGNSAEFLGSVNTFLYGDGGLNNNSINSYYDTNKNQLEINSYYAKNSMNEHNVDYRAYMYSRKIKYSPIGAHNGDKIVQSYDYMMEFAIKADFKDDLGFLILPKPVTEDMIAKGDFKEGEYFVTFGGYAGNYLTNNINDPSDVAPLKEGSFEYSLIIFDNNKSEMENDLALAKEHKAYNQQAKYPTIFGKPTGVPNDEYYHDSLIYTHTRKPESNQTYNSNSYATTICTNAGGINCQPTFTKWTPGSNKLIPKLYFDN